MGAPLLLWLGVAPSASMRLRYNGQLPIRDAPSPRADGYYNGASFTPYFWTSPLHSRRSNSWGENGVGHVTNDATVSLTTEHLEPPASPTVMKMFCLPREDPVHKSLGRMTSMSLENARVTKRYDEGCTCTVDGVDQGVRVVAPPFVLVCSRAFPLGQGIRVRRDRCRTTTRCKSSPVQSSAPRPTAARGQAAVFRA